MVKESVNLLNMAAGVCVLPLLLFIINESQKLVVEISGDVEWNGKVQLSIREAAIFIHSEVNLDGTRGEVDDSRLSEERIEFDGSAPVCERRDVQSTNAEICGAVNRLSKRVRRFHLEPHLLCRSKGMPDNAYGVRSVDAEMDNQLLSLPRDASLRMDLVPFHFFGERLQKVF